ncbi:hypothetical protein [Micromonospora viridifaciens]|uniref:hypothetical protein n=1 Tax=Micromonospora viridifaciens TaxID=1881 RepID=UPI000B5B03A2|nr:hypothetical protein [Micromonospora viridifaciens]
MGLRATFLPSPTLRQALALVAGGDRLGRAAGGLVAAVSPAREAAPLRTSRWCARAGLALLAASVVRRSRALDVAGGLGLAAGSLLTKFGYFHAGTASAADPRYTVLPQRERSAGPR